MRLIVNLLGLLLLTSFFAEGQVSKDLKASLNKRPWEWTLADRLAARLDPAGIAARELEAEQRNSAFRTQPRVGPRETVQSYTIDGQRHPELLLPHELFDALMTAFVPDERRRARQREFFRPGIVALGYDENLFWSQLAGVSGELISHKYAQRAPRVDPDLVCRAAFASLSAARQVFGKDRFDRFLYETVAPLTQTASATSNPDPGRELRRVAGGCQ